MNRTSAGHLSDFSPGVRTDGNWEVLCAVHGRQLVRQKTEPRVCKVKVQITPRCVRECRKPLMSAVKTGR